MLKKVENDVFQIARDFPSLKFTKMEAYLWEGTTTSIKLKRVNEAVIVEVKNLETGMEVCSFDARYVISVKAALKFFNVL